MENNPKKANHLVEFLVFLVVIICTALIILDVYQNVANELHGALVAFLV